jgi:hypothetical protein
MRLSTLVLLAVTTACMVAMPTVNAQQPCLVKAWAAFNKNDYKGTMTAADDCIDNFAAQAQRDQKRLTDQNVPLPPTGTVNDAEKNAIFVRGVLNDVGAAFFLKGRSAEYLLKSTHQAKYAQTARAAYNGAVALPHARTFDPQGWFWSTAEASSDRLRDLPAPATSAARTAKK